MNKFLKIFIFILLGVLQLTLMPIFSIKGVIPNLVLIGSIILLLGDFEEDAFYLAAFGGLVLDLAGPFFFGFHTIIFIGFIFLIRFLLQKIVTELSVLLVLIGVFSFSLLFSVLENLFLARLPELNIFIYGFYSTTIGLLAFMFLHRWHRKVQVIQ